MGRRAGRRSRPYRDDPLSILPGKIRLEKVHPETRLKIIPLGNSSQIWIIFIIFDYMKQRLYIDTSVFGGFFDEEFSDFTKPLINRLQKGEFKLLFSTVTQDELGFAPEKV